MERIRTSVRFGSLLTLLIAMGLLAPLAAAQDASPAASPAAAPGEVVQSITKEEYFDDLEQAFPFEEPQNTEGIYVDAGASDIQSFNPFLAEEVTTITVTGYIFESLIGGDPRTGGPAPSALADSWEVSADGLIYTFHLNPDARWHDGEDFTAEDVAFSFEAVSSEETTSTYTGTFNNAVASWRTIDDDTFQATATRVSASFLYDLFGVPIMPEHIWGDVPFAEFRTHPASSGQDPSLIVGTGPLRFSEWVQGSEITLLRNDDYYGRVPAIAEYVYRIFADDTAILNAFLNGEVDAIAVPNQDIALVQDTPGLNLEIYETRSFQYYEFNFNPEHTTLFQDVQVRQAFMYALDRQSIVDNILLGYGEVAQGTQPVISYAYAPDQLDQEYTYDPDRARELLAAAGWTDTDGDGVVDRDGVAMEFEFLYGQGSVQNDQLVAYMQDAWSQVGIAMTPRSLEFAALIEATTTPSQPWDMALYGFLWDATFIQDIMFGCDQYLTGFNDMMYCNPELDAIHDQATQTLDQEARAELLIEASNIVNEEQPIGVLYFEQAAAGWADRVHNFFPGPWGGPGINYIWIEEQ